MKNLTTLSLITATILGLTGCGETSSTSKVTEDKIELSSLVELSKASKKHEISDWIAIENAIQNLDNTEGFNTMLLSSITKNIAVLSAVSIDKEEAYTTNADILYNDLIDLDIKELDNQVVAECTEDEKCKEEAYASLSVNLTIDKEEAYAIATDINKDSSTLYGLLKEFTCESGLVRKVQYYGVEDNFSTANGEELAHPSTQVQNNPGIIAYNNGIGLSDYDTKKQNRQFAEEIKNLPLNITSGHLYIGLENHGQNDKITIGNMDTNSSTLDFFGEYILDLNPNFSWNKTGMIYNSSFSNIAFRDGLDLKNYLQNHNNFDVYVQDDTYVDFIAVATCYKPDPIKEVSEIINKFECSEQETLVKILGGTVDNFTAPIDPTTPRANLITQRDTNTAYPGVDVPYDYTSYDHHFIDTLNLGLTAGQTISKAQFNIGYKVIGSSLASNDAIYIGDFGTNHAGGHLYDTTSPIIPQGWNVNDITSYGHVAQVDLLTLVNNSTNASSSVGTTMENNNYLDVYVQDDTAVDFTQLNLCVKEGCDENAKEITLDLSQLASWTNKPSDAQENALNIPSAWASDMNWIKFDNNGTDRVLEIPFCACGDTLANITHLKGDNRANVELNGIFVTQPGNTGGITAFSADSAGGNHVDGTQSIAGTGIGVNHVLRLNVHNFKSSAGNNTPFGVAVEGTLTFKGNVGECQ
jgi:hypothetical protein